MPYYGRTRKHLSKADKERIKELANKGTPPALIAEWYDLSEFTVRKIAGLLGE